MNDKNNVAVIVLAAGSSTRMGKSKQLLSIDGKPLLRKSAEAAVESQAERVIVVLGAEEDVHRPVLIGLPVDIIVNKEWQKGMGSSIQAGLRHVISTDRPPGAVLIMVCDQPLLTATHLRKLMTCYWTQNGLIIASSYGGMTGAPALFDQSFFSKLMTLAGSQGARKILLENSEMVSAIPFPEGVIDLDTPEDYERFEQNS